MKGWRAARAAEVLQTAHGGPLGGRQDVVEGPREGGESLGDACARSSGVGRSVRTGALR